MQGGEPSFRFSTDDLPERDRLSIWREAYGRSIVKLDLEPASDEPLHVTGCIQALPNLAIASFSCSPTRVTRTRAQASDGNDDLVLVISGGDILFHQGKKEVDLRAGEALLWSSAMPGGSLNTEPIGHLLTLAISRTVLTQTLANLDDALMQRIPRDNEAMRLLTSYVGMLQGEIDTISPELKAAGSAHIQDLTVLALGANRDAAHLARGRGVRVARLQALKADILANLTRRDLSIDRLAARHGISPRYIRSLFDGDQTTFTDFVLNQRLARARRCLEDVRFAGHMISTIAFEAGFGDLSYFNLAFRRRYGVTPSDIRAGRGGKDESDAR
ncbi:AraC family transcriptional regulator [Mesorhizobium sp. AR02]|uniref:AraC family transcriptional regulator n=1 Tax=Mesorhizobium sp. AR02 TaxID=2865837 RepID=UPI00215FEA92|nr:AraC family transcriptional regulator [Mesorhizobium sp. AR02]UVK53600.1 AraC family transcriptional regulator [Mesorhizobium sp. AR02]